MSIWRNKGPQADLAVPFQPWPTAASKAAFPPTLATYFVELRSFMAVNTSIADHRQIQGGDRIPRNLRKQL